MSDLFKADNGREFEMSEHGFVSGDIEVDVNDLISHDLEGVMDLFGEKLVGNELLADISYDVVGAVDGQIVIRISGDVQHILASRDESDLEESFSP